MFYSLFYCNLQMSIDVSYKEIENDNTYIIVGSQGEGEVVQIHYNCQNVSFTYLKSYPNWFGSTVNYVHEPNLDN